MFPLSLTLPMSFADVRAWGQAMRAFVDPAICLEEPEFGIHLTGERCCVFCCEPHWMTCGCGAVGCSHDPCVDEPCEGLVPVWCPEENVHMPEPCGRPNGHPGECEIA